MTSAHSPSAQRYGWVAMLLHWLLALLIVGTFSMGLYMHDLPFSIQRVKFFNWHKWAGITILSLSVLRLLWRWTHRPPPLSDRVLAHMPEWQRSVHRASQWAMYALFFIVPLFGWAYSSAEGLQVVWFGVLPLPDLVAPNRELATTVLRPMHQASALLLGALVLLHSAAALKHHFIDRDGLIGRMWPTRLG